MEATQKKVGRPKGKYRNPYKAFPKRTVKTKTVSIKAYSWIYDVINPYLEVWFFSFSEFLRTAVRDAMLYCDNYEMSYFIWKSRKQREDLYDLKKIDGKRSEPICFKLLIPAIKQIVKTRETLEALNYINREGQSLGNITQTDYVKAAVLWYDEMYNSGDPRIEMKKINK